MNAGAFWLLGAMAIVGFGGGYLFSTRVLFPPPPPPGDLIEVPDLSGEFPDMAADTLRSLGLALGAMDSLRHPSIPVGMIVGQDPLPGQLSIAGDSVWLAVSTGAEERPVSDVMGLQGDRARTVLEAAGFTVVEDSVESGTPRGTVLDMTPAPGTPLATPAAVSLTVSKGPTLLEMPSVLDLEEAEAVEILESLGFVVGEVETRFRFGRDQGLVVEQTPSATSMVPEGSTVRLVVGRRGG